jgi:hypothetical protein
MHFLRKSYGYPDYYENGFYEYIFELPYLTMKHSLRNKTAFTRKKKQFLLSLWCIEIGYVLFVQCTAPLRNDSEVYIQLHLVPVLCMH